MVRAFRALTLLLTVALAAACSVKNTQTPGLSGPSELGLSLTMAATPDIITQDGASQAQVIVIARDSTSKPVAGLSIRLEITQGGVVVDFGSLSSKTVVTGSDGRASAIYTAPRAPVTPVDSGTVVFVLATPIGSNYASSIPREVQIRLVPAGVIIPPSDLVAGFTFSPTSPGELESVVFTAGACSSTVTANCTSGSVATYSWDFGDGGRASGPVASHQFQAGTFGVTLTVADVAGRAASTTRTVTVKPGTNPVAKFTASPSSPVPGQPVFFNGSESTGSGTRTIVDYQWDFGDGGTGRGVTTSHTYAAPGNYTVTLSVVDDAGRVGSTSSALTVSTTGALTPVAKITYSPTAIVHGVATHFSGVDSTAAAGIADYAWDFGDGTGVAHGVAVDHAFAAIGSYVVRLTVTDAAGRTGSTTLTLSAQ